MYYYLITTMSSIGAFETENKRFTNSINYIKDNVMLDKKYRIIVSPIINKIKIPYRSPRPVAVVTVISTFLAFD